MRYLGKRDLGETKNQLVIEEVLYVHMGGSCGTKEKVGGTEEGEKDEKEQREERKKKKGKEQGEKEGDRGRTQLAGVCTKRKIITYISLCSAGHKL